MFWVSQRNTKEQQNLILLRHRHKPCNYPGGHLEGPSPSQDREGSHILVTARSAAQLGGGRGDRACREQRPFANPDAAPGAEHSL